MANKLRIKDKQQLRTKPLADLQKMATEKRQEIVQWNMKFHTGSIQNVREGKFLRDNLAIIESIMKEKLVSDAATE